MKKKNIVLIMTDEQRFDSLGCMGNTIVKTPNMDLLAREGCMFTNAFCASPICVPSRVSMFTGQYVCRNGGTSNAEKSHIGLQRPSSFIEALKENGYRIGLAGKNHTFTNEYIEKWFDYREEYLHWGKTHGNIITSDQAVFDYRNSEKRKGFLTKEKLAVGTGGMLQEGLIEGAEPFKEEDCMTYRIAQDGIRFLEENKDQPFFLYYSFPDPHWPNVVCEPYYSMYNIEELPDPEGMEIDWSTHPFKHFVQSQVNGFGEYTLEQRKKILAIYYGMISFIDKSIGMLLDKMKELSLDEETLVIFCADHGNFAGRYGLTAKTGGFYDALVKIPLIVKIPGFEGNRTTEAQISNIDIFPTIFELLGLKIPEGTQGISFREVLEGVKDQHRNEIFSEVGKPEAPPPPLDLSGFREYRKARHEKDGCFWFVDYTAKGRAAMIRKNHLKYCYYVGDCEELYNLTADPLELTNLSECSEYSQVKNHLRTRLFDWILTTPFITKEV